MTNQSQIIPDPNYLSARQDLASSYKTSEGVLCCMVNPNQAVFVGAFPSSSDPAGFSLTQNISSSLTTVFYVGKIKDCEKALVDWSVACQKAIDNHSKNAYPDDTHEAVLAIWQHPTKDLAMLAVLCEGDWAADLERHLLPEYNDLTQVAFSGNDNEPVTFLPDFLEGGDDLLDGEKKNMVEMILLTVNSEWIDETLEVMEEYEHKSLADDFREKYLKKNSASKLKP